LASVWVAQKENQETENMNKIAHKLAEMNAKEAAAGITMSMVRGNALRNTGSMLKGLVTGNKDVARKGAKGISSAMNLFGRELAATKGTSAPKYMKKILKQQKSLGRAAGVTGKIAPGLSGIMAEAAGAAGGVHKAITSGANPYKKFSII
jgi:hypothetical protein